MGGVAMGKHTTWYRKEAEGEDRDTAPQRCLAFLPLRSRSHPQWFSIAGAVGSELTDPGSMIHANLLTTPDAYERNVTSMMHELLQYG